MNTSSSRHGAQQMSVQVVPSWVPEPVEFELYARVNSSKEPDHHISPPSRQNETPRVPSGSSFFAAAAHFCRCKAGVEVEARRIIFPPTFTPTSIRWPLLRTLVAIGNESPGDSNDPTLSLENLTSRLQLLSSLVRVIRVWPHYWYYYYYLYYHWYSYHDGCTCHIYYEDNHCCGIKQNQAYISFI